MLPIPLELLCLSTASKYLGVDSWYDEFGISSVDPRDTDALAVVVCAVNVVFAWWLERRYMQALFLLGFTLTVFRSELLLLAASMGLIGLLTQRLSLGSSLAMGLAGCVAGIGMLHNTYHRCYSSDATLLIAVRVAANSCIARIGFDLLATPSVA
jgi:hypothetical protein